METMRPPPAARDSGPAALRRVRIDPDSMPRKFSFRSKNNRLFPSEMGTITTSLEK